jgi:hypothetical protein
MNYAIAETAGYEARNVVLVIFLRERQNCTGPTYLSQNHFIVNLFERVLIGILIDNKYRSFWSEAAVHRFHGKNIFNVIDHCLGFAQPAQFLGGKTAEFPMGHGQDDRIIAVVR